MKFVYALEIDPQSKYVGAWIRDIFTTEQAAIKERKRLIDCGETRPLKVLPFLLRN